MGLPLSSTANLNDSKKEMGRLFLVYLKQQRNKTSRLFSITSLDCSSMSMWFPWLQTLLDQTRTDRQLGVTSGELKQESFSFDVVFFFSAMSRCVFTCLFLMPEVELNAFRKASFEQGTG